MTIGGGSTATQDSATQNSKSLENFTGYSVVKKNPDGDAVVENATAPEQTREAWAEFDARRSVQLETATAETSDLKREKPNATARVASAEIGIPAQQGLKYFLEPQDEAEFEGPPAPPPKPVVHRSKQEVCETLVEAAQSNDLPTPFFIRLLQQESGFKPGVVSPVGAQGVAQFMPGTAAEMGVDNPFDPLEAIPASARMLKNLFRKFGNLGLAAAAYNAGPKRVQDWLEKKGRLPDETRGYVKTITGSEAENWKVASAAGMTNIKLPRIAPCQQAAGLHAWNGPKAIPLPPHPPRGLEMQMVADAAPALGKRANRSRKTAEPTTIVQLAAHKTQNSAQPTKTAAATKPADAKKSAKKPSKPLQLANAGR
jgi:hypothetical protein